MNLPYLEFVDVDLSLLVSFRAHIHRSADQEEIRVGICIHVDSLQDAAEVGTDLPNKAAVDETQQRYRKPNDKPGNRRFCVLPLSRSVLL